MERHELTPSCSGTACASNATIAASGVAGRSELRRAVPRANARTRGRCERLSAGASRPHPGHGFPDVTGPRNRRLDFRHACRVAPIFEVDRAHVTLAALRALAEQSSAPLARAKALERYGIATDSREPSRR